MSKSIQNQCFLKIKRKVVFSAFLRYAAKLRKFFSEISALIPQDFLTFKKQPDLPKLRLIR